MGSRVGGNTPKQLLPLADGRSVLEHSVDAFEKATCIDEIAVVMHPDWMEEARELCERNTWSKVKMIIPGGSERWESSWHAILAYMDETDTALWLHDAARPFVSQRILTDVAEALETHEAVGTNAAGFSCGSDPKRLYEGDRSGGWLGYGRCGYRKEIRTEASDFYCGRRRG